MILTFVGPCSPCNSTARSHYAVGVADVSSPMNPTVPSEWCQLGVQKGFLAQAAIAFGVSWNSVGSFAPHLSNKISCCQPAHLGVVWLAYVHLFSRNLGCFEPQVASYQNYQTIGATKCYLPGGVCIAFWYADGSTFVERESIIIASYCSIAIFNHQLDHYTKRMYWLIAYHWL